MPLAEGLMLAVVNPEASSRPAICIASFAGIRGDLRRSRLGFVISLSLSVPQLARRVLPAALPPARPGPAPRALHPLRLCPRAAGKAQLHFTSIQVRPRDEDLDRIPQPEAMPGPLRAKREPVLREGEGGIPDRAFRDEPFDAPPLDPDEQPGGREPRDHAPRLFPEALER